MKMIKGFFITGFYYLFCILFTVYSSIKYILMGKRIMGRFVIIAAYAGVITLGVFIPTAFWVLLGVLAFLEFLFAISVMKSNGVDSDTENEKSQEHNEQSNSFQKNPSFDGMAYEDAKREYRKLMKQYHPDNVGGDTEMSQKISAAFSQFKGVYRR